MNTDHSGPLGRVARAITDGQPVDWAGLLAAHPEHRSRLEKLRLIQSLADSQVLRILEATSEDLSPAPDGAFTWGPLRVIERIGEGSFGEVYRAFDPVLHRDVALKLQRTDRGPPAVAFPSHLDEARRLARVRHPNVLTVYGVEVHDDRAGMWTDFIRGETLEERIRQSGPLDLAEIGSIARDLCAALTAVHEAGIIHGDIKAANVMREGDGRIILMDFGAGSTGPPSLPADDVAAADGPSMASLIGTPMVMAPELLQGEPQSIQSDIYALGVLLYRLASGRYPIEARTAEDLMERHRANAIVPLRELRPDLPDLFVRAIERALSPEPGERHAGAREMGRFLSGALGETPLPERAGRANERLRNVARPETNFIGRTSELSEIRRLLASSTLVTIIGPGGMGKTRLALEAAEALADGFPDGAVWIELAPLSLAERVGHEVARGLGLHEEPSRSIEKILVEHLSARGLLLVLDNCEHVRAGCARLVTEIRGHCPNVHILATSREALRVPGEETFSIPPMRVPETRSSRDREGVEDLRITESEAVRLFIDRACRSRPGFTLTRANAPLVAEICRRLEGLPLAIELAAARVKVLGTEEIATRLRESFGVLATNRDSGLPHHATLTASIDWGHRLLTEPERILFRRLSVFSGRWTLETAGRVCADAGQPIATILGEPILDLLTNLVDRSMVVFDPPSGDREGSEADARAATYHMLEILRQFAFDALIASGEDEALRTRHLTYFHEMAEEAHGNLFGPDQEEWLERLALHHDNFRAALDWSKHERADADAGLRIAVILRRFWFVRGELTEGRGHLKDLLARPAGSLKNRNGALLAATTLAWAHGDTREAERLGGDALRAFREANDREGLSGTLTMMGTLISDMGDYDRARAMLDEALALRRELGNKSALASILCNLGVLCARMGDLRSAASHYEEAAALLEEMGDLPSLAIVVNNLSATARDLGDLPRARALADRCVPLLRASGNRRGLSQALLNLAKLEQAAGDLSHARELHIESLLVARDLDDLAETIAVLESFGELCVQQDECDRAARLFGAVEVLREMARIPLPGGARDPHADYVALARGNLGEGRFTAARAAGRTMNVDQAIALVLGDGS